MIEKNNAPSASGPWIDTHCHLTDEQFAGEVEAVVSRAIEAGVSRIIVVGDRLESSRAAVALAAADPERLRATVGVHPHNANEWSPDAAEELREICRANSRQIVAVGEIGLDFFYDLAPREKQIETFLEQAEIGRGLGLPLVMHCRDAYDLFIDLIREHDIASARGVVHCFSGTPQQARRLTDMGLFLGIGGALTFKKNDMGREAARSVPIESLLLETDAPYLAPAPRRGKRNEPALLVHTAARLAEELGVGLAELSETIRENTRRLFG